MDSYPLSRPTHAPPPLPPFRVQEGKRDPLIPKKSEVWNNFFHLTL